MSIALAIIAKDEKEQLERIVSEYAQFFDEIAIAYDSDDIDNVKESLVGISNKVNIYPYKWINDFSDKRNFLASKIESEYYLRLDTDDVIKGVGALPKLMEKVYRNKPDVIYFEYIYSRDEDGNCVAKHWRETIIKKSSNHYWKKKIHENIFIEDQSKFSGAKDDTLQIIHNPDAGHSQESFDRNLGYLLDEYNEDKENTDPRTIAYLGRMMMGLGKWVEAIGFLQLLVSKSGWEDDKYFAYAELAFCHLQIGELDNAKAACFEAIDLNPDYPDAYICLGEIYLDKKEFEKANNWLLNANTKKMPDTMYVVDPSRYSTRLAINLSMSYFGMGHFDKAKLFFDKARKISPSNGWIKDSEKLIEDGYYQDVYMKSFNQVYSYLLNKDKDKILDLVKSVPKNLICDERIQKLRHDYLPPKTWSDKSIVIFCGQSWEEWADPSVISGLGGSEEAVVYLSRELVRKGYEVTVFNGCGDLEGEYYGVNYIPFYYFNPKDKYNIIIGWRGNIFENLSLDAKKKYIWMHDVPQPDQFKESEMSTFDKIIVQSDYHKSLFPDHVKDDKFLVSRNGINLIDFDVKDIGRKSNRMIYTSSYDRGIQHLLLRWKEVKEAVPDAELHLFYGWDVYDRMIEKGFRSKDFRDKMTALMNQDGVYENGRVGHKRLNKEFQKSGLWVYPSHFEEISCISAMKAQANGCIPVVVNYAALKETVKSGIRVEGRADEKEIMDKYISELISILSDKDRQVSMKEEVLSHKDHFGWDLVAEQWSEDFNA